MPPPDQYRCQRTPPPLRGLFIASPCIRHDAHPVFHTVALRLPRRPNQPRMFSFQELPSFLSLLASSPPPLAVAVLFFPSPSPPLSTTTFAAPHPSSASMVSSAPPSHPVADASLPESSYMTKGDDGNVQIKVQYMLVVGGGVAGRRGVAERGTCGWATMGTGCRHDEKHSWRCGIPKHA